MENNTVLMNNLVQISTMLAVADMERSVKFYSDKLGFKVLMSMPTTSLLRCGTAHLYLATESGPTPEKPTVTLALLNKPGATSANIVFQVKDCEAVYRELTDKGLEFLAPPQSPPWGGLRCFTQDPDGYLIEIVQPAVR